MRKKQALVALFVLVLVACHTSKKSTTSTASSTTSTTTTTTVATTTVPSSTVMIIKPLKTLDGVYEPGEEELVAVQPQYKDATLAQLKEGYILYAKSACISCHGTVNIYTYPNDKWPFIISDMAYRAKLSTSQKDAVLKYVYAIKAADPNKK